MIPDALYSHRRGGTDSEAIFLIALGRVERDGPVAAVEQTLATIRDEMDVAGIDEALRFSAALTDGQQLQVFRWSSDPLAPSVYYRQSSRCARRGQRAARRRCQRLLAQPAGEPRARGAVRRKRRADCGDEIRRRCGRCTGRFGRASLRRGLGRVRITYRARAPGFPGGDARRALGLISGISTRGRNAADRPENPAPIRVSGQMAPSVARPTGSISPISTQSARPSDHRHLTETRAR